MIHALQRLRARAVADAHFDGHARAASALAGVEHFDGCATRSVVGNRGLWHDDDVGALFENYLRVGSHVGLELVPWVVDGYADFEVRDIVPLHAHRRDLRDLPLERPIL